MRKSLTLYEILALYIGLPEGNKSYTNAFWLNNLAWPPNLFAVCACILNETGDYVKLVSPNTTITNLYENGYITYMRTDSVHLSSESIYILILNKLSFIVLEL